MIRISGFFVLALFASVSARGDVTIATDSTSTTEGPQCATLPLRGLECIFCAFVGDLPAVRVCGGGPDYGYLEGHFPHFYYNDFLGDCFQFAWSGCGTNGNIYQTREECRDACRNGNDDKGLADDTGSIGEPQCAYPVKRICSNGPDYGSLEGHYPHFYYNDFLGDCFQFAWSGCTSNGNIYQTIEECREACRDISDDHMRAADTGSAGDPPCSYPEERTCSGGADFGYLEGHYPHFYYNDFLGDCFQFAWSGCGTNGNIYESREECRAACRDESDDKGLANDTGSIGEPECEYPAVRVCSGGPDYGFLEGHFPHFYYSDFLGDCYQFAWSGCGTNGNIYESREGCRAACRDTSSDPGRKLMDVFDDSYSKMTNA